MGGAEVEGPQGTFPELSPVFRHGTGRSSRGGPITIGGKGVAVAGGSPAATLGPANFKAHSTGTDLLSLGLLLLL